MYRRECVKKIFRPWDSSKEEQDSTISSSQENVSPAMKSVQEDFSSVSQREELNDKEGLKKSNSFIRFHNPNYETYASSTCCKDKPENPVIIVESNKIDFSEMTSDLKEDSKISRSQDSTSSLYKHDINGFVDYSDLSNDKRMEFKYSNKDDNCLFEEKSKPKCEKLSKKDVCPKTNLKNIYKKHRTTANTLKRTNPMLKEKEIQSLDGRSAIGSTISTDTTNRLISEYNIKLDNRIKCSEAKSIPIPHQPLLDPYQVCIDTMQTNLVNTFGLNPNDSLSLAHTYAMEEYAKILNQDQQNKMLFGRKQRPKKYKCPYCDVGFSNNGQLKGHIRIHTGERPFLCDEKDCGKTFTRNEELTRHKRIHSGLRPYPCVQCGKRFGRKDHLKKHTRTHILPAQRNAIYYTAAVLPLMLPMEEDTWSTVPPNYSYYLPSPVYGY